jgi:hypothetical protein
MLKEKIKKKINEENDKKIVIKNENQNWIKKMNAIKW